jgi:hypothetical protein
VAQISLPLRIALVAVLAVGALWMTVLKPKTPADDAPLPTAPGVTGLANDVSAAKGAVDKSNAANAKTQAATGGVAGPATSSPSAVKGAHDAAAGEPVKPAGAAAPDRSAPLIRALDRRKAVVLLFWSRRGADDRAVRRAVRGLPTRHGRVVVKVAPISHVGRYTAITSGAEILQSPTTLVIGPDRTARPIVGLTTTGEVDQAVADALRAAKR